MNFKDYLDIATSVISLIGVFFFIYLYFRSPDEKAERQLGMNKIACDEKHQAGLLTEDTFLALNKIDGH